MQLQGAKDRFEKQGIRLAAICYDSPEILKEFSERKKIEFPLLSDPDSKIIRSFQVLNEQASGMTKGMAFPGFFYIDKTGVIREKFFEDNYAERFTPNNVIAKLFPELAEEVTAKVTAPHIGLTIGQSDRTAVPGSRVVVDAEIQLPGNLHVYAPEVKGYIPVKLTIQAAPDFEIALSKYPRSKPLYLKAIKETVPVYEGKFRITADIQISLSREFTRSIGTDGKEVTINGELKYQACDERICYPPTTVPVSWKVQVIPLESQRSPESIRHK